MTSQSECEACIPDLSFSRQGIMSARRSGGLQWPCCDTSSWWWVAPFFSTANVEMMMSRPALFSITRTYDWPSSGFRIIYRSGDSVCVQLMKPFASKTPISCGEIDGRMVFIKTMISATVSCVAQRLENKHISNRARNTDLIRSCTAFDMMAKACIVGPGLSVPFAVLYCKLDMYAKHKMRFKRV